MKPRDAAELLLLAAIWGCSFLFMRIAAPQLGPVPLIAARVTIAFLFLLPFLLVRRHRPVSALFLAGPAWLWFPRGPVPASAWLTALALGVFCTGVAYILFYRLVEHAGPARAMSVTFLVPIFTMAFGALFLGEAVTPRMALACAVVLVGTGCATGLLRLRRRESGLR